MGGGVWVGVVDPPQNDLGGIQPPSPSSTPPNPLLATNQTKIPYPKPLKHSNETKLRPKTRKGVV